MRDYPGAFVFSYLALIFGLIFWGAITHANVQTTLVAAAGLTVACYAAQVTFKD